MTPVLLPAWEAVALFERFVRACGPEEMARAYDYPATFFCPLPTERVWKAWESGEEAGWFSLVPDPFGGSLWARSGLFPAWRRKGLWRSILEQLRREAFADPAIRSVRALCLLSNVENAQRMLWLSQALSWYDFDGFSLHPPAYQFITRRDAWEAHE